MKFCWLFIAMMLSLEACGIGPLVPVVNVDQDAAERLAKDVPVYRNDADNYVVANVKRLEATSCKNKLWDKPASADDAISQLRYKASSIGANAITNPTCQQEGTSVVTNCWSSITCTAEALKVDSKAKLVAHMEQEFWRASPLTKADYEDDSRELNKVSARQWEALRNFNAGVENDEDRIPVRMISKEQRRAIVEIGKWLIWKDQWVAQKKSQLSADLDKQQQAEREEEALAIRRFEALQAARPRFTHCFPDYLGGVSCAQY